LEALLMGGAMRVIEMSGERQLWLLSALILIAALLVTPGFFSIDEAIYYLGGRALAEGGSLGIHNNGFEQFHSEALKLRFLVDGPQGLTPQYPAGSALLAAPFLPLLGPWAFILPNSIAAILTLFTVRKICLSQFKDEKAAQIAVILLVAGTFWVEYAIGIWPHAISAYFAVQAYWFALRHLESDSKRDVILAGVFAGLGMPFRLDAILAVPAIGLILVLFAPRFIRSSFWFGLGVLPSIALVSWLNVLKFGSANPFSYGQSGGNTDVSAHSAALVAVCVGFALLAAWRKTNWKVERKAAIALLAAAGIALLMIPATNALLLKFWNGFLSLVVDMRNIDEQRLGIEPGPGGTVLFWNLAKKALGQSMPWIGIAAILLTSGVPKQERRFVATLLIFMAIMTLPFVLLSWHGGGGSNMRYFLPILPTLCILCARPILDLWRAIPNAMILVAVGIWAALLLGFGWTFLHPSGFPGVQQIVSTFVLLATMLAAMAAGVAWRFQQAARQVTLTLFAAGLLLSAAFATSDFMASAARRSSSHDMNEVIARLPPNSLVITFPEWAVFKLPANGSLLAVRSPDTSKTDRQLTVDALDAGYRVFITSFKFDADHDVPQDTQASINFDYSFLGGWMVEVHRNTSSQPEVNIADPEQRRVPR
jgi:hypothetical protein